jgi:hypothetical protein
MNAVKLQLTIMSVIALQCFAMQGIWMDIAIKRVVHLPEQNDCHPEQTKDYERKCYCYEEHDRRKSSRFYINSCFINREIHYFRFSWDATAILDSRLFH